MSPDQRLWCNSVRARRHDHPAWNQSNTAVLAV